MTATSRPPISVVIADDVREFRELLRVQLERDEEFLVVGEAGDGETAIRIVEQAQPHCLLLDLAMPVMDGLEAIPEIRRVSPETKIAVLSGFEAALLAPASLDLGADLYLEKGSAVSSLSASLRGLF